MIWSFWRKKNSELSPEVQSIFDEIARFIGSDDEQVSQYPEPLKSELLAGESADSLAGTTGPFGLCPTNPIPVNGPIGEILYLSALRFGERRVLFHRIGSFDAIDRYECVSDDGKHWDVLFLDMYHPRKSRLAPRGYSIAQNFLLSGTHNHIANFPQDLYAAIIEHSTRRFGMSIADPRVKLNIQATEFRRPPQHAVRISKIIRGDFEPKPAEVVELLANEVVGTQASLHDRLIALTTVGLRREEISSPEIAYFVLSLAVHSIFRWSRRLTKSEASDQITLRVLKLNKEANELMPPLADAIHCYRERLSTYRSALLQIAESEDSEKALLQFGQLLCRNITGKHHAILGEMLSAATGVILAEMRAIISDAEHL